MKKKSTQKRFFSRKKLIIVIIVAILVVLLGYKVEHDLYYGENYCEQQAHKIVGKNWGKKIPATDIDKKDWASAIMPDGTIYIQTHELIRCEEAHHAFLFF